jgi:hypothetical protein
MATASSKGIVAAIILAGLLVAGAIVYSSGRGKSSTEEDPFAAAKAAVTAELSDPDSATFRNVREWVKGVPNLGYCGEVNAKNRMGGYVGFRSFLVSKNKDGKLEVLYDPQIIGACK